MEGFPVHTEPFVADERLRSRVSVTCQAAGPGLSRNSRSKPQCADVGTPSLPWDTENQLGGKVCHGACRETLWCRRCGLCYVGNSCTVHKPDWAPAPTVPTTPSVISLHPQQLPSDMLMHLRLHTTFQLGSGVREEFPCALPTHGKWGGGLVHITGPSCSEVPCEEGT